MDESTMARVLGVLAGALDQPSNLRELWITVRLGSDVAFQDRTLLLLRCESKSALQLRTGASARSVFEAKLTEQIGAYGVTELIGQSGMGTVQDLKKKE